MKCMFFLLLLRFVFFKNIYLQEQITNSTFIENAKLLKNFFNFLSLFCGLDSRTIKNN